ncbi:lipopolysaccharide biosynthesis protein [Nocardioides sp. KR10-350]|uniref:lipopolysaccharide biosynthesis protein n=1 Tax=Nocardioides cheoyonin TaxID=3156615 RepID=UPI0032B32EE3
MSDTRSLPTRAVRGVAWVAVEKWGGRLLTLLVFSILGRILSPDDFGLMALAASIGAIVQVFVENGMAEALVQKKHLEERDVHTAFWTSVGTAIVLYAALVALSPLLAAAFDEPRLASIIPVSALVLPIASLYSVPAALLERELQFRKLTFRQLGGSIVGAAVAITLALVGAGVWALVLQPVATGAAAALILWFLSGFRPKLTYSRDAIRGIWTFSMQVIGIEFLNAMQSNVDKLVVGSFFTPAVLGYYFIAQRLLTIVMEVIAAVLAKVSLTTFSRVQDEPERMLTYFKALTFASAAIAFPIYGGIVAFGHPITDLLFGSGWDRTVPMMILMAPSAALASVTFFDKSVLLARGRGNASLKVAAGQFVFGTVVLLVAVPFGINGVAAARSIRQIVFWPVRIYTLHKHTGLSPVSYLLQFVKPILATAVLIAVGLALQATPWAHVGWSTVTFLIPAGLIVVACYLATMRAAAWQECLRILRVLRRSYAPAETPMST